MLQMKFINSLVECGFPLNQIDEAGKDPLMIIYDNLEVQGKQIIETTSLFLKNGYRPTARFMVWVLKTNRAKF